MEVRVALLPSDLRSIVSPPIPAQERGQSARLCHILPLEVSFLSCSVDPRRAFSSNDVPIDELTMMITRVHRIMPDPTLLGSFLE